MGDVISQEVGECCGGGRWRVECLEGEREGLKGERDGLGMSGCKLCTVSRTDGQAAERPVSSCSSTVLKRR